MKLQPWHGFLVVGFLILLGRESRIFGGEDFAYFILGTLFWGGFFAGAIWSFTRKRGEQK